MQHYTQEKKAAVLARMSPPKNERIAQISEDTGISTVTLYQWRKIAREQGKLMADIRKDPEQWSSADKFAVVLATASMNSAELAAYCRAQGLFIEQVTSWREACMNANPNQPQFKKRESGKDKKRVAELEKELRRKNAALAEAAALLVLRKKLDAFYHGDEDK